MKLLPLDNSYHGFTFDDSLLTVNAITYFLLYTASGYPYYGTSLWLTDGTALGTHKVFDDSTELVDDYSLTDLSSACNAAYCVNHELSIYKIESDTILEIGLISNGFIMLRSL
jgi:hypothetical protein